MDGRETRIRSTIIAPSYPKELRGRSARGGASIPGQDVRGKVVVLL